MYVFMYVQRVATTVLPVSQLQYYRCNDGDEHTRVLSRHIATAVSYTQLYYTLMYYTLVYNTLVYYALVYYALVCSTLVYYTLVYNTLVYNTLVYNTLVYYTLVYYTLVYYTLVYYTPHLRQVPVPEHGGASTGSAHPQWSSCRLPPREFVSEFVSE